MQSNVQGSIDIPESILDENPALELGIFEAVPAQSRLPGHIFGVVKYAGGSPHIAHSIVVGILAGAFYFIEFLNDIRGNIHGVVGSVAEIPVYRKKQILTEHTLYNIVGRTDNVEILVSEFNLGKHYLVHVEKLVDDFHIFSCLFLVPGLEFFEQILIDIVCPVVDFESVLSVSGRAQKCRTEKKSRNEGKEFFHFFVDFIDLKLMIIKSMSTAMKISVIIGRISGVRPPLRASA